MDSGGSDAGLSGLLMTHLFVFLCFCFSTFGFVTLTIMFEQFYLLLVKFNSVLLPVYVIIPALVYY